MIKRSAFKLSLSSLSSEKRAKMPLIELTRLIMLEEKQAFKFKDAFNRAADLKGLSDSARSDKISQFYTDLNMHGSFVMVGENKWGLKSWYKDAKKEEDEEDVVRSRHVRRKMQRVSDDDDADEALVSEFAMIDRNIDEFSDEDFIEEEEEEDFDLDLDDDFDDEYDDEEED